MADKDLLAGGSDGLFNQAQAAQKELEELAEKIGVSVEALEALANPSLVDDKSLTEELREAGFL